MAMKKLSAKYPGTCTKCGGKFPAGTDIMWGDGKTEHASCPSATAKPLIGLVAGGTGVAHRGQGKKTNQKAANCDACGEYLKPGKGELVYCVEDSGCMKHHDHSGWHVYCLDAVACKANKEEAKVARQKAAEEAKIKAAEKKAAEEAESAAYKSARAVADGLVSVTCDMPDRTKLVRVREVARNNSSSYKMTLTEYTYDGVTLYCENANSHDDWRTYWLVPPALAKEACLAYAAKVGITVEKARDWMSKYSMCSGAEIYQAVLDAEVQTNAPSA